MFKLGNLYKIKKYNKNTDFHSLVFYTNPSLRLEKPFYDPATRFVTDIDPVNYDNDAIVLFMGSIVINEINYPAFFFRGKIGVMETYKLFSSDYYDLVEEL